MSRQKVGLLVGAALLVAFGASAYGYPLRPITLIVPWAAGGSTDLTARALAPVLSNILGQPVQPVNRTGGGGAVGHQAIARAVPDGHTIGIITLEVVLPAWVGQTGIAHTMFAPISLLVLNPVAIVVRKDAPWRSARDLIADIRANPGKYKASGTARAGSYDYARVGFLKALGLKETALPWVPSQGAAAALQELMAGGVNVAFVAIGEASALVRGGEARYLAFMTEQRHPVFSDVPTLKDLGINWTFASFLMAAGPKFMPFSVVRTLDAAFGKAVQDSEFVRFMNNANLVINYLNNERAKAFLAERAKAMQALADELR